MPKTPTPPAAPENNQPKPDHWLVDNLKKQVVAVMVAALWAFYTFIWNSQASQSDLRRDCEANTKQIEKIVEAQKQDQDLHTQFLIGMTKTNEMMNRLATDVKTLQDQQQRTQDQLMNRK